MVKQRMSSVDVAAEVACLRNSILGLRVANIYDLNAKVTRVAQTDRAPRSPQQHLMYRLAAAITA
jgi:hypothetical protein